MCRVFGAVAASPISSEYELLTAPNPLIRQSENHDSGWGMAVYPDVTGDRPAIERFPVAAHTDHRFPLATGMRGRIFNVHVRRATLGGLTAANTHPFELGPYTFSHNGTILNFLSLLRTGMEPPHGETDSEHMFRRLMHEYDPDDAAGSFRRLVASVVASSVFSGLNFLFSDGERLYAYRLGLFDLFWTTRKGVCLVASERLTNERWHCVQQDVLLTLDPLHPEEPHAERLIGNALVERSRIEKLEPPSSLSGAARGAYAAERVAALVTRRDDRPQLQPSPQVPIAG